MRTLLDMTQEILSAMSSDEVNSIGDTVESLQVATIIRRKTQDIWARSNLPEKEELIQLVPSGNADIPVVMTLPENVDKICWIKYFNSIDNGSDSTIPGYQYITILPIDQFIRYINLLNPNDTTTGSFVFVNDTNTFPSGYTFYYRNNRQPSCCTIISNRHLVFDSINADIDSTLKSSKTMCLGRIISTFVMEDTYVPELTVSQEALLLNESKALAFVELKQMPHAKAEQEIQRQWSALQHDKYTNTPSYFDNLPYYGRK